MEDEDKDILELAEFLGWPHGVLLKEIIVPGGEACWRAFLDRDYEKSQDERAEAYFALEWAADKVKAGYDPGPPERWYARYKEDEAAQDEVDEQWVEGIVEGAELNPDIDPEHVAAVRRHLRLD